MDTFNENIFKDGHYESWNNGLGNNFERNDGIHKDLMIQKNIETGGGYQATVSGMYGEFTIASIFKSLPDEFAVLNDILIQTGIQYRKYTINDFKKYGETPWELCLRDRQNKRYLPLNKGIALNRLLNYPCTVLYEAVKKSSQIDHVIVSPYGIFVIETKNHKGYIFGNDTTSRVWTQVLNGENGKGSYGGHSHFTFMNPIIQNNLHIEHLVKATKLPSNYIEGFVVFTNPDAYLGNVMSKRCFNLNMLSERILSYTNVVFSIKQRDNIINIIENANSSKYSLNKEHIKYVKDIQHRNEINKYYNRIYRYYESNR